MPNDAYNPRGSQGGYSSSRQDVPYNNGSSSRQNVPYDNGGGDSCPNPGGGGDGGGDNGGGGGGGCFGFCYIGQGGLPTTYDPGGYCGGGIIWPGNVTVPMCVLP